MSSSYTPVTAGVYPPQHADVENTYSLDPPSYPNHQRYLSDDSRQYTRTPSPTPSEQEALSPKKGLNLQKYLADKKYWPYIALIVILIIAALLFAIFNTQIIHALKPVTDFLHNHSYGPVIAIATIVVLTFPPLWGADLVAVLCGITWGVGPGFGIVAAGTFLGEVLNYTVFKYMCSARGAKMEQKNIKHAVLARVIREGGFVVALVVRYSAIPPHFATAIFATCGMPFLTFAAAAVLSLPKQFLHVYIGVLSDETNPSVWSKRLGYIIFGLTIAVTIWAMRYLGRKQQEVTPIVIYERRKARQGKLAGSSTPAVYDPPTTSYETEPFAAPTPKPMRTGNPTVAIPNRQTSQNVTWDMQPQYQAGSPGFASPTREQTQAPYVFATPNQTGRPQY